MGRREISLVLLATGVLCGIIFTLLNLGGVIDTRLDKIMLYVGIIAIAVGLVIFATASSPIKKVERQ